MPNTGHQEIKCDVFSCKHSDKSKFCTLQDIRVGHEGADEAHACRDTVCTSFCDEM